jgi:hypothetical protein
MDHDALREACKNAYDIHSLADMSEPDLMALYQGWTGKTLRRKRAALPKKGDAAEGAVDQMISGEELTALDAEFAKRSFGREARTNFIRRQLQGRDTIRTRRDFAKVFHGVRAMNRREGLSA